MDYFKQRREYRKLKQNEIDISIGQNNLYRELLDYANDEDKLDDWFPLKNSALTDLTGLSIPGLAKARNSLTQLNLIEYRQGKKNSDKPQYKITCLYNKRFTNSNTAGLQEVSQKVVQPVSQTVEHKDLTSTIPKLDTNLTDASESNKSKNSKNSAVTYWLNQVNPAEAPFVRQSIEYWVNDFGGQDEIVILAINDMLEHDARNYNYLNKILKNWEELKLDTPEKVKNHLVGKYSKKTQKQAKGRVEQLPDHIANPKTEAEASALARQKLIDLGVTPND
ncbi:DnaD domain-containing protein [Enterococcus gilvus]|uniref:DnaD domain-containing protein n=1 Tax=Enterococcus gilvus ATCC BAA-350 TaxID=1158614 RepID=R2XIV8_9ENTE|nr:DnaD domain protein [Enterococcus gilvus]EOI54834.1 DnaD domain-containing protein [Enterococcus gilvus ATCC BAA-350]EOW81790.1 hypothetical protein I592_01090 [Enterococcus gilvus ATCC BAA-350]